MMCHTTRTTIAGLIAALGFCACVARADEQGLTRDELHGLLKERDAVIIQLQHTVRDLLARVDAIERSADLKLPEASHVSQPVEETPMEISEPRGFARLDIDEDAAQRALERTLTQGGALLLPAWRVQIVPSAGYSLRQTDFPAIVPDGDELLLGSGVVERSVVDANIDLRVGLPFASQLEIGIPYRWVNEEARVQVQGTPFGDSTRRNGRGIGSIDLGFAKTFVDERGWRPDVVGRINWITGSGSRMDDDVILDGGFESVGASLSLTKRTDPLVFLASLAYRRFFEDDGIEPGDQLHLSFGTALAVSPSTSLIASVSNQFRTKSRTSDMQVDGTDINSYSLHLGASTLLATGVLFNLTTGIGISKEAPDYSLMLSASMQSDALQQLVYRR